jgi:hypothetical protein
MSSVVARVPGVAVRAVGVPTNSAVARVARAAGREGGEETVENSVVVA